MSWHKKLKSETQIRDTHELHRRSHLRGSLIWKNETRPHHRGAELARWRVKRRWSSFWTFSVKLISEMRPFLWQKGDVRSYYASSIMQVKETCICRGMSHFITKAWASPILSPIMKAPASPFYHESGLVTHSVYRGQVLEWRISILFPPYKAHS
jgi:hypothetical protein